MRRRASARRFGALLLALTLLGCSAPTAPPTPPLVSAGDDGLIVAVPSYAAPFELTRASIFAEDGELLAELPAAGLRRQYELPFRWDPKRKYRVVLEGPRGKLAEQTLTAPLASGALCASVQVPFGQAGVTLSPATGRISVSDPVGQPTFRSLAVAAPPGSELEMGLLVECLRQTPAPTEFEFELELPAWIIIHCDDPRVASTPGRLVWKGALELEHDYAQVMVRLQIPAKVPEDLDSVFLAGQFLEKDPSQTPVKPPKAEFERYSLSQSPYSPRGVTIRLHTRPQPNVVELADIAFPCDSAGEPQPERLPDAVVLADPVWSRVHRLLRPTAPLANEHEPLAWQSLQLKNDGPLPVNLRIECEVAETPEGKPLLEFAPTAWIAPTERPTSEHLLTVPSGTTAAAVLPLFVRREVRPGHYVRRMRVFAVGSSQPLVSAERPLDVIRGDAAVSGSVLAALVGSLIALVLAAWHGRRVVAGIGVEGLATIGMMASVQFAAAYLFRIGTHVLAGVLGPFAIFVTGVGNEGISSLLMAVTLTLVPRVGAASLTLATLWVLNSLFTGQFGLVDFEFLILSCLTSELALALLGVTSGTRLREPHASAPWTVVLRLALALGAAKGMALYLDLCLVQVLFRLYFAPWYVLAVALCVGLGYGAAGATVGTLLGYQLRRTAA